MLRRLRCGWKLVCFAPGPNSANGGALTGEATPGLPVRYLACFALWVANP